MIQFGLLFLIPSIIFLILSIWFYFDKKTDVAIIFILLHVLYIILTCHVFRLSIGNNTINNEIDIKYVFDNEPECDYFIVDKDILLEYIKMNDNRDKDREKYDRY